MGIRINERVTSVAWALAALIIVIALLSPRGGNLEPSVSTPSSEDKGNFGLGVLKTWLDLSSVPTLSLRARYDSLTEHPALPADGNLLIISLPQYKPSRHREQRALSKWLKRGNSALVLLAWGDYPLWARNADYSSTYDILNLFNIKIHDYDDQDDDDTGATDEDHAAEDTNLGEGDTRDDTALETSAKPTFETFELIPNQAHVVTRDITPPRLRLDSDDLGDYNAAFRIHNKAIVLLKEHGVSSHALVNFPVDDGTIWLSKFSTIINNAQIEHEGNGQLVANIIRSTLKAGGHVIFDDFHHGLSDLYDPDAFFADTRLHASLWIILGFWIVYVIGHNRRIGPIRQTHVEFRNRDFANSIGAFYARKVPRAHLAQAHFARLFNDARERFGLPRNGQPAWEQLLRAPRIDRRTIEKLQTMHTALSIGKTPSLVKLTTLVNQAREKL